MCCEKYVLQKYLNCLIRHSSHLLDTIIHISHQYSPWWVDYSRILLIISSFYVIHTKYVASLCFNFFLTFKVSHYSQYPAGTEFIYSYFESRGGRFPNSVFFGLQYILKKNLVGQVITHEKIDEAKSILLSHFGRDIFNEEGWRYIVNVSFAVLFVKFVYFSTIKVIYQLLLRQYLKVRWCLQKMS